MHANRFSITTHTIVKNEDRWLWYAIKSVIDQVSQMIIFDTGSTDNTIKIIKSFNSPKIIFKQIPASSRKKLVDLRNSQIQMTKTPWFMLLDGDEIWPKQNLAKLIKSASIAPASTLALFTRTRNCINDIYHYLPQSKGKYVIKGIKGHLNIRLIKNHPKIKVKGRYPLETYVINNKPIQSLEKNIKFVDTWYLHTTHLRRSTKPDSFVIDRKIKQKFRLDKKIYNNHLPKVLFEDHPDFVPPPPTKPWHYFFPPK